MARLAIILHEDSPGSREVRLGRILDFFGVPWKVAPAPELTDVDTNGSEYAFFGSIRAVAAALERRHGANTHDVMPATFYAFVDDERSLCVSALGSLLGLPEISLEQPAAREVSINISGKLADLAGPMAGLDVSLRLNREDAVLTGGPDILGPEFLPVISAEKSLLFVRIQCQGSFVFFCSSSQMVDIDQLVSKGYYDVKQHFCSVVPLVMFIKYMFHEVGWQPQELGACLIIDDPLLKLNYGFCDFSKLRQLMQEHKFTTNIAFIPWNWRRTSSLAGKFFNDEAELFSVSIHGCDHTAGEFATTSPEALHGRALLACDRMQTHQARTGIQHCAIMVFPQGAFSSVCPEVLKHHGFLAAVNTEINPVDIQNARTRIRDVWDVAIMTYGDFPIFTRRYAFHGLENFAFDLLLGKPCLIVTHHDSFKDGGVALIGLIKRISSLNCNLRWRPLGDVIRRACRRRLAGTEQLEMYGNELRVSNSSSERSTDVKIRKRMTQPDLPSEILCDGRPNPWTTEAEHLIFGESIGPHSERCFKVLFPEEAASKSERRSLHFEAAVAIRRLLSEFRDEYLSTSRFLSVPAERIKAMIRKN
jgi:hypothetical protein